MSEERVSRAEVLSLLVELGDEIQRFRENGESDMRSALWAVDRAIAAVEKLEDLNG